MPVCPVQRTSCSRQGAPQRCWTQEGQGEAGGRLCTVVDRVNGGERVVRRGAVAGARGLGPLSSTLGLDVSSIVTYPQLPPAPAEWVCLFCGRNSHQSQ